MNEIFIKHQISNLDYASTFVSVDPSFPVKWLSTTKHDLIIDIETKNSKLMKSWLKRWTAYTEKQ